MRIKTYYKWMPVGGDPEHVMLKKEPAFINRVKIKIILFCRRLNLPVYAECTLRDKGVRKFYPIENGKTAKP